MIDKPKLYELVRMVSRFTATNDTRSFLNYVHVAHENEKTIIFASDGYIAVRAAATGIHFENNRSINKNIKYGIEYVEKEFDRTKVNQIKDIFNAQHQQGNSATFNIVLLNRLISAVSAFARFCSRRIHSIDINMGDEKSNTGFILYVSEIQIAAMIMPMRK